MASIVERCTEAVNSTDCLLRVLITFLDDAKQQQDAKIDWDPITLGATVPISALALYIGVVTLFQTFYAAEAGRRKADRGAIGNWARKSLRRWNYSSFDFSYITRTPVLRLSTFEILQSLPSSRNRLRSNDPVAATWVLFLDVFGLNGLDDSKEVELRSNSAEYLPADMLAAPAYAEVGLIVILMSLMGARIRTEADSDLLSMRAHGCLFDIRHHATLGLVGSFSQYEHQRRYPLAVDELRDVIRHATGKLNITIRYEGGCSHRIIEPLIGFDRFTTKFEICPKEHQISPHHDHGQALFDMGPSSFWPFLFHILMNETPKYGVVVFPWGRYQLDQLLVNIGLGSPYTMPDDIREKAESFFNSISASERDVIHEMVPSEELHAACASIWQGTTAFKHWLAKFPHSKLNDLRHLVLKQIRCIDAWIAEKEPAEQGSGRYRYALFRIIATGASIVEAFEHGDPFTDITHRRSRSRAAIQNFTEQYPLDKLQKMDGEGVSIDDTLRSLADIFGQPLHSEDRTQQYGLALEQLREFSKWWAGRDTSQVSSEYPNPEVSYAFVWRCILLCILYCLAHDNSSLMDSGMWNQIIPIL